MRRSTYGASGPAAFERCAAELTQKWHLWNAPWDMVLDLGFAMAGGDRAAENTEAQAEAEVEADAAGERIVPRRWPVPPEAFDALCATLEFADDGAKAGAMERYRALALDRLGGMRWLSPGLATGLPKPTVAIGGALGACLSHSNTLVYLDLMLVGLDGPAVAAMFGALRERALPALTTLRLAGNPIGDEGVGALADALRSGKRMGKLKLLDLSGGDDDATGPGGTIGDAGLKVLAGAIDEGALPACRSLFLHRNAIGDEGLTALAGALYNGGASKLLALHLDGNRSSVKGALEIVKVCQARGISEDLAEAMMEAAGTAPQAEAAE